MSALPVGCGVAVNALKIQTGYSDVKIGVHKSAKQPGLYVRKQFNFISREASEDPLIRMSVSSCAVTLSPTFRFAENVEPKFPTESAPGFNHAWISCQQKRT